MKFQELSVRSLDFTVQGFASRVPDKAQDLGLRFSDLVEC